MSLFVSSSSPVVILSYRTAFNELMKNLPQQAEPAGWHWPKTTVCLVPSNWSKLIVTVLNFITSLIVCEMPESRRQIVACAGVGPT